MVAGTNTPLSAGVLRLRRHRWNDSDFKRMKARPFPTHAASRCPSPQTDLRCPTTYCCALVSLPRRDAASSLLLPDSRRSSLSATGRAAGMKRRRIAGSRRWWLSTTRSPARRDPPRPPVLHPPPPPRALRAMQKYAPKCRLRCAATQGAEEAERLHKQWTAARMAANGVRAKLVPVVSSLLPFQSPTASPARRGAALSTRHSPCACSRRKLSFRTSPPESPPRRRLLPQQPLPRLLGTSSALTIQQQRPQQQRHRRHRRARALCAPLRSNTYALRAVD